MATSLLSPSAKQQFLDNAGIPAAGFKLHTYATGTTNNLATYTDRAGLAANANPILLDARGEAIIYLTPGLVYDYVLTTAAGVPVWTRPGITANAGDADAVSFTQSGIGANARTVQDKLRERATVLDFINVGLHAGLAAGTELSPQQAGFNAALVASNEVFVPAGTYYLSDMVTIPIGKRLVGAGRRKTLIRVPATFNLAAAGVFRMEAGEPGGEFTDMTIEFEQPDAPLIGSYTQYPSAINAQAVPRCKISRIRIVCAWDGINLKGNSGGATVDDFEVSCFNKALEMDGSLDSIKITRMHLWPFGPGNAILTTNQRALFKLAYGIHSTRSDDLHISDSLFFDMRKAAYFTKGVGAGDYTFGAITNCSFDGDAGFYIETDSRLSLAGCYWSKDEVDSPSIRNNGGNLRVSASRIICSSVALTANGSVETLAGHTVLSGCTFERGAQDNTVGYVAGSATMVVTGGNVFSAVNTVFTKPVFHFAGTSLGAVTGVYTPVKGTGAGPFVTVAADNGVNISSNNADGWTVSLPAARTKTICTGNVGPETDQFAGCVDTAGASAGLPFGWSSASVGTGNYTVTHSLGLNAVRDMVVNVSCESGDSVAIWDVASSTVNQIRVRTFTAGVAANAAFSFTMRRRR